MNGAHRLQHSHLLWGTTTGSVAPSIESQLAGWARAKVAGMHSVACNRQPSNKGLEQTGRVGAPALRAVVGVTPRSSSQCSTG